MTDARLTTRTVVSHAAAVVAVALILLMIGWFRAPDAAAAARVVPAPAVDASGSATTSDVAVLAGGCFWGVQGVFQHVTGVANAVSGYAGGDRRTAHYEMVGTGAPVMPNPCRSRSIRAGLRMGSSCRSTSQSPTIPRSSIARGRTTARSTVQRSFRRMLNRHRLPRPTSHN